MKVGDVAGELRVLLKQQQASRGSGAWGRKKS